MAQNWHYETDGERQGPITSQELKQLAASGELQPSDLIWKDGMAEWKPAQSLKGLFQAMGQPKATEPPPITGQSKPTAPAQFWEHTALIIASLVFCFPVGLFLVWKTGWDNRKKWIYTGACGVFVLAIFVSMQIDKQEAAKKIAEADSLWEEGEHEKAVVLYREVAKWPLDISDEQRPMVFGRLIDHAAKNGDTKEVRRLFERSSSYKPDFRSDEAKRIVAQIEAEKKAEAAKKEAEQETKKMLSQVTTLSGSEMVDFMDNTKKYKGKVIRMTLRMQGGSLRSGGNQEFHGNAAGFAQNPIALKMRINIRPSSIDSLAEFETLDDLPNITGIDEADITFLCEQGSLNNGNRAIRIARP